MFLFLFLFLIFFNIFFLYRFSLYFARFVTFSSHVFVSKNSMLPGELQLFQRKLPYLCVWRAHVCMCVKGTCLYVCVKVGERVIFSLYFLLKYSTIFFQIISKISSVKKYSQYTDTIKYKFSKADEIKRHHFAILFFTNYMN